jgi:hypothetical protein
MVEAGGLGHRLIRSEPYSQRSEFDGSEIVVVSLVVACGDGAEVFEAVL